MSFLIYYLVPAAFLMVVFLSWVLTRTVRAKSGMDVAITLFLLVMMVAMLLGPAYLYLATLNLTLGDVAIWEIAVFMSVGMMPIGVLLFAKFWIEGDAERTAPLPLSTLPGHVSSLKAVYIALLVASEILMGWAFNLATGLVSLTEGYSAAAVFAELEFTVTTYWFIFTMVGEMFLTLFAFRKTIGPRLRTLLLLQAAIMFLTPTALQSAVWEQYTLYAVAAVMTGVVVFSIDYLRRTQRRERSLLNYIGLFIVANAVMMGGLLWWFVSGETFLLAATLILESVVYFDAVLTGAGLMEAGALAASRPLSPAPPSVPSGGPVLERGEAPAA